jgi:glycosyltransferase involved in cell wall biosynthesis
MKICLISRSFPRIAPKPGVPVTIYVHTLAEELVKLGHDVDVICGPIPNKNIQSYNIIEVGYTKPSNNIYLQNLNELWFSITLGLALKSLHKKQKWDIVQFFENPTAAFAAHFWAKKNMPPYIFSTGTPVSGTELTWSCQSKRSLIWKTSILLHNYVFKHIENITTNSNRLKDVIIATTGIDPVKITVAPFITAEPDIFHPGIDSTELRNSLNLTSDNEVILCLGEVAPYKNQFSIVQSIQNVITKHPNVRFVFVGGLNKEYSKLLQQYITDNSLQQYVIFTGFIKETADLPKYYNMADIYILLSHGEGNMPKTTMEAMACGKSIIVSDMPQNREGAIYGDEMIFVNPNDLDAIAGAVNLLLDYPNLRKILGENALRTINEYYTPVVIAKRIIKIYKNIINNR